MHSSVWGGGFVCQVEKDNCPLRLSSLPSTIDFQQSAFHPNSLHLVGWKPIAIAGAFEAHFDKSVRIGQACPDFSNVVNLQLSNA